MRVRSESCGSSGELPERRHVMQMPRLLHSLWVMDSLELYPLTEPSHEALYRPFMNSSWSVVGVKSQRKSVEGVTGRGK